MVSLPNDIAHGEQAAARTDESVCFRVHLRDANGAEHAFLSSAETPLLHGMIAARLSALNVGCRGGGCGICRIKVLSGGFRSLPMSRSRISQEDEAVGIVLACRVIPQSDITIEAYPLGQRRDGNQP